MRYLSRCCEVLAVGHLQYFKMTGFVPESPIFSRLQFFQFRKNWRFWYKTSHFEILWVHDLLQAPRNSGRKNAVGFIIVWWPSPPLILQLHLLHQVATDTPSHVPSRRRRIIIAVFHDFGTNSMVRYDWNSAPRCVCGPSFVSDLNGKSAFFSAAISPSLF